MHAYTHKKYIRILAQHGSERNFNGDFHSSENVRERFHDENETATVKNSGCNHEIRKRTNRELE